MYDLVSVTNQVQCWRADGAYGTAGEQQEPHWLKIGLNVVEQIL